MAVLAGGFNVQAQVKPATVPASPTDKIKKTKDAVSKVGQIWKKKPPKVLHETPKVVSTAGPHASWNKERPVVVDRPDHSRIFAARGGHGYVQRPFVYGGGEFAHRTYYYHGRIYSRYYGRHDYHGVTLYYYAPGHYYRPAFYSWAFYDWAHPVPYVWGFSGSAWYGYYGYYFTPAATYPGLSLWLTDYLISTSLADYYQERLQTAALAPAAILPPSGASPITPEVKDLISAEVKREIALETVEANTPAQVPNPAYSSIQQLLGEQTPPVFVAGSDLDVVSPTGDTCVLSPGDALQLAAGAIAPDSSAAPMVVLASKGDPECHKGASVSVQIADLQEMQNYMRATIDAGMAEIHNPAQGAASGLPAIPASLNELPVSAGFLAAAPPADPNVAAEIDQQIKAGEQSDRQNAVAPIPAPVPPPMITTEIILGESVADATTTLGNPYRIAHNGSGEIYFYKDMKITFTNGKVSSIERPNGSPGKAPQ